MKKLTYILILCFSLVSLVGCSSNKNTSSQNKPTQETATSTSAESTVVPQRVIEKSDSIPKYYQKIYDTSPIIIESSEFTKDSSDKKDTSKKDNDDSKDKSKEDTKKYSKKDSSSKDTKSDDKKDTKDKKDTEKKSDVTIDEKLKKYTFIGDLRFSEMKKALDGYIGEDALDYIVQIDAPLSYFNEKIIDISDYKDRVLVFCLGMSDIKNYKEYISFYNDLPKSLVKNNTIVIVSLPPVTDHLQEDNQYKITNIEIAEFNSAIQKGVSKKYNIVDLNSHFILNGIVTRADGVQYDNDARIEMFNYIVSCVEKSKYFKR